MEIEDSSDEDEYEKEMKNAFDLVNQREVEKAQMRYEEYQRKLNDQDELDAL